MRFATKNETTMKIAVPLFKDRVSPYFGVSSEILVVEMKDGRITYRGVIDTGTRGPWPIARRLVLLGANKLVCGGIQLVHKQWLTRNGIRVVDNQKGLAEEFVTEMIESDFAHGHEQTLTKT